MKRVFSFASRTHPAVRLLGSRSLRKKVLAEETEVSRERMRIVLQALAARVRAEDAARAGRDGRRLGSASDASQRSGRRERRVPVWIMVAAAGVPIAVGLWLSSTTSSTATRFEQTLEQIAAVTLADDLSQIDARILEEGRSCLTDDPSAAVDLQLAWADRLRMGLYQAGLGVSVYQRAVDWCEEREVDRSVHARALVGLGHATREADLDKLEEPFEHYARAESLMRSDLMGDEGASGVFAEVLYGKARCWIQMGDRESPEYELGGSALSQALLAASSLGDIDLLGRVYAALGDLQSRRGDYVSADRYFDCAEGAFCSAGDLRGQAIVTMSRGNSMFRQQDILGARSQWLVALDQCESAGDEDLGCRISVNVLPAFDYARAKSVFADTEARALRLGNLGALARLYVNYSSVLLRQGELEEAYGVLSRALRYRDEWERVRETVILTTMLAQTCEQLGRVDEAMKHYRDGIAFAQERCTQASLWSRSLLAKLYLEAGENQRALEELAVGDVLAGGEEAMVVAQYRTTLAACYISTGVRGRAEGELLGARTAVGGSGRTEGSIAEQLDKALESLGADDLDAARGWALEATRSLAEANRRAGQNMRITCDVYDAEEGDEGTGAGIKY